MGGMYNGYLDSALMITFNVQQCTNGFRTSFPSLCVEAAYVIDESVAPTSATAPPPAAAHRPLTASLRAPSEDEASTTSTSRGKRFTINKVNKASRKKREKSFAKKERKATKTLAIVLGVFLFCWVPFFSCNVMDAVCTKLAAPCNPSLAAFIITTWLGYMNSFVNPVIYTIFNPEFRKAFKKLMGIGT